MNGPQRVVVVGGGFAGASVVKALLGRAEESLEIHLLEREPYGGYDRFELARVLRGEVRGEDIVRFEPDWFRVRGVHYHAGARVHFVDRFRRLVHGDGLALPYDKLILATGSGPYLPSIQGLLRDDGSLHPGVFTVRTLADIDALARAASSARRVAVLGGGRLGIEIVEALSRRELQVHLFHVKSRLMSGHLDDAAAAMLKTRLDSLGVHVHFAKRATALDGGDTLRGICFQDGSSLDCDLLVLATGFQPETWLGFQCGLTVERGLVVEGRMRSIDDLDVHALGECAQWRGAIHGLPSQISDQAHVIAEHLTRRHSERRYVAFKQGSLYQVMGLNLSTLGRPEARADDDVVQLAEPSRCRYKKVVLRDGRLVSAILLGDVRQASNLARLYASNARLTREARHKLFELAMPRAGESVLAATDPGADKALRH